MGVRQVQGNLCQADGGVVVEGGECEPMPRRALRREALPQRLCHLGARQAAEGVDLVAWRGQKDLPGHGVIRGAVRVKASEKHR